MTKHVLLILGGITLILGLLWFPSGVGDWGALATQVRINYSELVRAGVATENPSATATLVQGLERSMAKARAYEAAFLVVSGVMQLILAAGLFVKDRRSQAPSAMLANEGVVQVDVRPALGISKEDRLV